MVRQLLLSTLPSAIRLTSVDVPPMSKVMMFGRSITCAMWTAPLMPPLGPDNSVSIGRSEASSGLKTPPPELITTGSAARPSA